MKKFIIMLLIIICIVSVASAADSPTLQLGKIRITKIVAIDGEETLIPEAQGYTFKFKLIGPYGFTRTYEMTIEEGHKTLEISDLEPGPYKVIECGKEKHFTVHGSGYYYVELDYNKITRVTFINDYHYDKPTHEEDEPETPPTTIIPLWVIETYNVSLGIPIEINHCGDCFD